MNQSNKNNYQRCVYVMNQTRACVSVGGWLGMAGCRSVTQLLLAGGCSAFRTAN